MIVRLQRIATFLIRFRLLIFVLAGASLVMLMLSILENPWLQGDALLIPSILSLCWALMLYSVSELFVEVPPIPTKEGGFWSRFLIRIKRALRWLIGFLAIATAGALLALGYQLLRTWL